MRKIKDFVSDLSFLNRRNYVHSSSLLLAGLECTLHYLPEINRGTMQVDAQFHEEISHNGIFRCSNGIDVPHSEVLPKAVLRFRDNNEVVTVAFIEDEMLPVQRQENIVYSVSAIKMDQDYTGSCHVGADTIQSLITNVIEANKKIHLLTLGEKSSQAKIMNLYMRQFSLPEVVPDRPKNTMRLVINNRGVRDRGDSLATLNTLTFPETNLPPFEMAFAVYLPLKDKSP